MRPSRAGKGGLHGQHPKLLIVAKKQFGSYRAAVQHAGIDYAAVSRRVLEHWTDQQILNELRRMHAAGEDLCLKAVSQRFSKLIPRAVSHFGSYAKAVEVPNKLEAEPELCLDTQQSLQSQSGVRRHPAATVDQVIQSRIRDAQPPGQLTLRQTQWGEE